MAPSIDEPTTLPEKLPLENEKRNMIDNAISLQSTVHISSQQESRAESPSSPSLSDPGKDPEKGIPQTTIENKDSGKSGSENEAEMDLDLVSGKIFDSTSHTC
jgi:hypothetical protein